MTGTHTETLAFLIFEGFPMACLTSMIEPLRAANEIAGTAAFGWKLIGERPGRVTSSADVAFEVAGALGPDPTADRYVLLSSPSERFAAPAQTSAHLRKLARHGTAMIAVSGGVFPLVRAGLAQGRPVSVHWCYEAAFKAEFPDIDARSEVIVKSPRLSTVSGAAAAFDLALHLIEDRLGRGVSHEVACWFQHPLVRGEGVRQTIPAAQAPQTGEVLPDLVARAVEIFAEDLSAPVSVDQVARRTGVTPRQVARAFNAAVGQSPSRYFRDMRMKAARQLVLYSRTPVAEIAAAVGYASSPPLVSHYREAFGLSPSEDRRRVNQFRVSGNAPVPSL